MRRALLALFSTIAGLVVLLSFKTQATDAGAGSSAIGTAQPGTDPAAGSDPSTSSGATAAPSAGSSAAGSSAAGSSAAGSSATGSSAAGSSAAAAGSSTSGSGTYTGTAASTRYGPVQVQVTVTAGKVSSVTAVEYPTTNPRDAEINARAIPELNQEATAAGSAKIDVVSGATYTSDGYMTSLQSALDAAGL